MEQIIQFMHLTTISLAHSKGRYVAMPTIISW